MFVTASWGGAKVAVEVDADCRSVGGLKRCLQEALPEVDVEAVRLEVCGRSVDDEAVLGLFEGSVIDVSATQAALAAAMLREEGCDVDFRGVCRAANAGNVRQCKLYLETGVVWPPGDNPLHIAVTHGHRELCKLFLDSDCDREAKDEDGNTPLHRAIYEDNPEFCKLLLDAGCETDVQNERGNTPLHLAVSGCCSAENNTQLCKLLLDSGCAKNLVNDDGETPLQSCDEGTEVEKHLLSRGCV